MNYEKGSYYADVGNFSRCPRDLKSVTQEAFGHERFVSIDRIANNGLYIEGEFHSDKWGDFRTYFNFELNDAGRIVRLDIGQVDQPSE